AEGVGAIVDGLTDSPAAEDALRRIGCPGVDPFKHDSRARTVAGAEETVSERQAQPRFPAPGIADRAACEGLCFGGSAKFEQDQRLLLVAERGKQAARG